ncbi:aspartate kinase [Bacillaceae bacterium]
MRIRVQKFGGSSLSDPAKRRQAIRHIENALQEDYHVVVVVSAMGRKGDPYATDSLIQLIRDNGDSLAKREMDLLLSCGEIISAATLASMLRARGHPAVVLTGGQAGIITSDDFSHAQILTVETTRLKQELAKNGLVIVCGFQGKTIDGEITTLGRGGSDTTAAALGAALRAEVVEIFTDVAGIMTADPRIVSEARPLTAVTYTEICNMAYQGAKVIHPRAVELAMQHDIPIRVRSTFSDDAGTLVASLSRIEGMKKRWQDRPITGIAHVPHLTQIKVYAREGEFDLQAKVFKAMAENGISVDFINVNPSGVAYTVFDDVADRAAAVLRELGYEPQLQRRCAKVSAIGAGMAGVPGVMAKIAEALLAEDIRILQSADSHATIWVLVREDDMAKAVRALHRKFGLDRRSL